MIVLMLLAGIGLILVLAAVIAVINVLHDGSWRAIAAERRRLWEARHEHELHYGEPWTDTWQDD